MPSTLKGIEQSADPLLIETPELDQPEESADRPDAIEIDVTPDAPHQAPRPLDMKLQLARRLAETRIMVDRVLETVSESRLEARRLVTKELRIDPRPEVLHTIVKIACDPSNDGLQRELPRHLLTVYALVEFELGQLLDTSELNLEAIHASREILPELRQLSRQIQAEITGAVDGLPSKSQDYMMQACNSLTVPEEAVNSALLIAPRLELFVRAGASGDLHVAVPCLDNDEVGLLCRLFEFGYTENAPGRICLNSVALRSMMLEDIERWEKMCGAVNAPEDGIVVEPAFLERLSREKTAFHFISDRLQSTQDSALLAGLNSYADEVRSFRQNLFATYLKFTPILRGATVGKAAISTGDDSALRRLIEETREADAAADALREQEVSNEEIYLNALTGMRRPDSEKAVEPVAAAAARASKDRRRLQRLVGTAAVLFAICLVIYVPLIFAPSPPPPPTAADFASAAALTETVTVGTTMYAQISAWSWNDLTLSQQLDKVEELGRIARSRQLDLVLLANEAGQEVGYWNITDGAVLVQSSP